MIYSKESDKDDNNISWRLLRLEKHEDRAILTKIAAPVVKNVIHNEKDVEKFINEDKGKYRLYSIPEDAFQKILKNFTNIPQKDRKGVVMREGENKKIILNYSNSLPITPQVRNLMAYRSLFNHFSIGHVYIDENGNTHSPL